MPIGPSSDAATVVRDASVAPRGLSERGGQCLAPSGAASGQLLRCSHCAATALARRNWVGAHGVCVLCAAGYRVQLHRGGLGQLEIRAWSLSAHARVLLRAARLLPSRGAAAQADRCANVHRPCLQRLGHNASQGRAHDPRAQLRLKGAEAEHSVASARAAASHERVSRRVRSDIPGGACPRARAPPAAASRSARPPSPAKSRR